MRRGGVRISRRGRKVVILRNGIPVDFAIGGGIALQHAVEQVEAVRYLEEGGAELGGGVGRLCSAYVVKG